MTCSVCGSSLRKDNRIGVCRRTSECKRVRARIFYDFHAEKHRESCRKKSNDWYHSNKDRAAEYIRKYRADNLEWYRSYNRQIQAARRARKRGQPTEIIDEWAIYQESGGICGICNLPVKFGDHHLDHIIPISLNGPHLRENVQIAHPGCNLSKGNRINETDDKIIRARKLLAERGCADVSVPALAGAGQ